MTQLDLILETYVHAGAETVARGVGASSFVRELWPQWNSVVSEDRGPQGVRWVLDDSRFTGSVEVWIESVAIDACVLHSFVRVDRRRGRVTAWQRRRIRSGMLARLWRFKDDVEKSEARAGG
ncbi:MAG: hypothetical protein ACRD0P_02280 [Stackebrandtia sp.]